MSYYNRGYYYTINECDKCKYLNEAKKCKANGNSEHCFNKLEEDNSIIAVIEKKYNEWVVFDVVKTDEEDYMKVFNDYCKNLTEATTYEYRFFTNGKMKDIKNIKK